MTKEDAQAHQTTLLKRTKRELGKALFFFTAGALTTAILMLNNRRKQKERIRLKKALEEQQAEE